MMKKQDLFSAYKLTQEDKEELEKLAKDPRIGERVCSLRCFIVLSMLSVMLSSIDYIFNIFPNQTVRLSSLLHHQYMAMKT